MNSKLENGSARHLDRLAQRLPDIELNPGQGRVDREADAEGTDGRLEELLGGKLPFWFDE